MTKRDIMRTLALGLFSTVAAATLSSTAGADTGDSATASLTTVVVDGQTVNLLRYTGTAGDDLVEVDSSGGTVEIRHFGTTKITAGPGCLQFAEAVSCGPLSEVDLFRADLNAGNDRIHTSVALRGTIDGGSDGDAWRRQDAASFTSPTSSMTFLGGDGNDTADYQLLRDVAVAVTTDNLPNDGTPRDSDNVTTSVEEVKLPS